MAGGDVSLGLAQASCSWHALTPEDAVERLRSDATSGLAPAEVNERLAEYGENALTEAKPRSIVWQFFGQFADVTVIALLVAAILAVVMAVSEDQTGSFLEQYGDGVAISIIVLLNAIIGFLQERKAEKTLHALKDLSAPQARVLRATENMTLPAAGLVLGDVVLLEEGDRVPADLRLLQTAGMATAEAALTGESTPVEKHHQDTLSEATPLAERNNMVFMGTHVSRGTGRGVVVATGMGTELGNIAGMLGRVERPVTPLQQDLQRFGTWVVVGCVVVGTVVFALGMLRTDASLHFMLLTAISLAVAAIPEGLPAISTIVMALGVQRMAHRQALIRHLAAVETLGSTELICTDKTGTLTENRMVVRRLYTAEATHEVSVTDDGGPRVLDVADGSLSGALKELILAAGCTPAAQLEEHPGGAPSVRGDPTDAALLLLHHAYAERSTGELKVVHELPFDGERKRATSLVEHQGHSMAYTHGAPETVLEHATKMLEADGSEQPLTEERRAQIEALILAWAAEGIRVLGLARRHASNIGLGETADVSPEEVLANLEHEQTLIGLIGIADPPRAEVRQAIATAARAGVTTLMITGDHPLTGEAIARELGLISNGVGKVVSGEELDKLTTSELAQRLSELRVVARATAAHKLKLIEAFTAQGKVVAMTGDGVNDAPAIKAASIGIAMGRAGTDVAREAADMVLMDDNYATIVHAIEEGRVIYANIKRFIIFLFAVNTGLVLAVATSALLGWPAILAPTQILWINLVTNGLPALALGIEPVHTDPMGSPPRARKAPLVTFKELSWLLGHGVFMALLGMLVFNYYATPGDEAALVLARTMTFTVLAVGPLFHALNARSIDASIFSLGVFSHPKLLAALAASFAFQAIAVYVPALHSVFHGTALATRELAVAIGVSASVLLLGETEKLVRRLWRRARES